MNRKLLESRREPRARLTRPAVLFALSLAIVGPAQASKILFVWEGAEFGNDDGAASLALRNEYLDVLGGAGHTVVERALTTFGGGVANQNEGTADILSGVLDASFDQVWIVNLIGTASPANLGTNDLLALQGWSTDNARDEWIVDGLAWRGLFGSPQGNMTADEENFTINMANVLESAGGGILVGSDNEQPPVTDPASGSGTLVATVNQVLGAFAFDQLVGAYSTPASSFEFGGSFFSGPGSLPANPTNFSTSTGSYAEIPTGLQPNGRFLAPAVRGIGMPIDGFNSTPLPGNVNNVVSTTISGASLPVPLPEPGTGALLAAASLVIACASRRRRGARAAHRGCAGY